MANIAGGSIIWKLDVDDGQFKRKLSEASSETKGFGEKSNSATSMANKGFQTLANVGIAAVAGAAIAATALIVKNLGNAVQRVDTLNNFPKVMSNLGYTTDEASAAIKTLDLGVRGLPTSLSGIASALQNIAPSSKSLSAATDLTLALNNALLAGGQSADIQATAMTQFSQAISKGRPDMLEWRSLAVAMPGQLDQIGQSLGYGRGEWQKMAKDVSDGVLPFESVKDAIVKLNKNGLGQFPSFAEQAKNASGGLNTAITNANTAITRGIANVIQAIGTTNITNAIVGIGNAFETALKGVVSFIKVLQETPGLLEIVTGALVGFGVALVVAMLIASPAIAAFGAAVASAAVAAAPFIAVGAVLAGIAFLIQQNWDKISPIVDRVKQAFVDFWETLKPIRDFIGDQLRLAFDSLVSIGKQLWENMQPLIQVFKDLMKNEQFVELMKQLAIAIGVIVALPLATFIGLLIGGLYILANVLKFVADHFETIKTVATIIGTVVFGPLILTIMGVIKAFQFLADIFAKVMEAYNTYLAPFVNFVIAGVTGLFQVIASVFNAIFQIVWTIVSTLVQIVIVIFQAWFNFLRDKIFNPLFDFVVGIFNKISSAVMPPINAIINFIRDRFNEVYNYVVRPMQNAFNEAMATARRFADVGRDIIQGIVNGLRNAGGQVVETVKRIAAESLDAVKSFFGIKSPSKVMADVGKNLMYGMANGISSAAGSVVNTAQSASNDILGGFGGNATLAPNIAGEGFTGAQRRTYVYNVTQNNSGIVAQSRSAWREINKDGIEAVNEELRAKGAPEIGGGYLGVGGSTI